MDDDRMDGYQPDTLRLTVLLTRAVAYVVYAFVILSVLILVQGFILKLLGANPDAGYADWAYRSLNRVMEPFRGLFIPIEIDDRSILDTSILFAIAVYGVVGIAIRALLDWLTYRLRLIVGHDQGASVESESRADLELGFQEQEQPATDRARRS